MDLTCVLNPLSLTPLYWSKIIQHTDSVCNCVLLCSIFSPQFTTSFQYNTRYTYYTSRSDVCMRMCVYAAIIFMGNLTAHINRNRIYEFILLHKHISHKMSPLASLSLSPSLPHSPLSLSSQSPSSPSLVFRLIRSYIKTFPTRVKKEQMN